MPTDFVLANTNGRIHPASEPSLPPLNRGFLYGDAIYEVWRTYHGVIFAFDEHWQRLQRSADALFLTLPLNRDDLQAELLRTARAFREQTRATEDLYLRLQITRGAGPIGLDPALADRPDYVILVQVNKDIPPDKIRTGYRLSLATSLWRNPKDSLNPAWKTGNYLNNLLCLREARTRGADEVVITNHEGEITEAAVCNLAFVCDQEVVTPPLAAGILEGITRGLLLRVVAAKARVVIREKPVYPKELAGFQECMLLSSTRDIAPVAAIDGVCFRTDPNALLWKLKQAFADYALAYAGSHPELKI